MLAALPTGRVWPREPDAVLPRVMEALGPTYGRMTARALGLLRDAPAGTLDEMLPDWEATLGLPDPCAGDAPSLPQRRASVRAAIAAQGGQSAPYFVAILAALGRTGTVTNFAPARAGLLAAGEPLYGPEWSHAWLVTLDAAPSDGDAATDAVVRCVLDRLAPAHTALLFRSPENFNPAEFGADFQGGSS